MFRPISELVREIVVKLAQRGEQASDSETIRDLRFRRDVERLHALGPRPQYELLVEIGAEFMIPSVIEEKVAAYADLSPEVLRAVGGDRFPLSIFGVPR